MPGISASPGVGCPLPTFLDFLPENTISCLFSEVLDLSGMGLGFYYAYTDYSRIQDLHRPLEWPSDSDVLRRSV